jgi:hypothetical protein
VEALQHGLTDRKKFALEYTKRGEDTAGVNDNEICGDEDSDVESALAYTRQVPVYGLDDADDAPEHAAVGACDPCFAEFSQELWKRHLKSLLDGCAVQEELDSH